MTSSDEESGPWVGKVPAERRPGLADQRSGERHHRHDVAEAPEEHGDARASRQPRRVRREPGEGGAVAAVAGIGVEQSSVSPCGPALARSPAAGIISRCDRRETEDRRRYGEHASFIPAP